MQGPSAFLQEFALAWVLMEVVCGTSKSITQQSANSSQKFIRPGRFSILTSHVVLHVKAALTEDFNPSGSLHDISVGIDLRGLGWAFAFACTLDDSFEQLLRAAHLKIGESLDIAMRHLVNDKDEWSPTRTHAMPDEIGLSVFQPDANQSKAEEGMPRIVFNQEQHGIAVFFKPPGWEVDDDDKLARGKCLSSFLQWKYPWSTVARDSNHAFGMIHRLDVPSSGLILTGTTFAGYYVLKWQLDTGQIEREYVVLCHGWIAPALRHIDVPVHHISARSAAKKIQSPGRSAGRSMVIDMGKPAETFVRVLAHAVRGAWRFSLIVCRIRTGRRHQIRTHLLHVGHPTVADGKYTRAHVFAADKQWCPRNFLHRHRLVFSDAQNMAHEVKEPLPADLRSALRQIEPSPAGGYSEKSIREWIFGHALRAWNEYAVLDDSEAADLCGSPPHWAR